MMKEDEIINSYYEYLCDSESLMTKEVKGVVEKIISGNMKIYLEGLDKRVKSKQSFILKCNRNDRIYPKIFYVYDVLRYTIILPIEHFYSYYQMVIDCFKENNFKIYRVKNTWHQFDKDIPYRGVNVLIGFENGLVAEVQFHTKKSYKVNIDTHELYEKLLICSNNEEILKIKTKMKKYINELQTPNGVDCILEYKNEEKMLNDILGYIKNLKI